MGHNKKPKIKQTNAKLIWFLNVKQAMIRVLLFYPDPVKVFWIWKKNYHRIRAYKFEYYWESIDEQLEFRFELDVS